MVFNYLLVLNLIFHGSTNLYPVCDVCQHRLALLSRLNFIRSASPLLISHKLPLFFPDHQHYIKFNRVNVKVRIKSQAKSKDIESYEYYN